MSLGSSTLRWGYKTPPTHTHTRVTTVNTNTEISIKCAALDLKATDLVLKYDPTDSTQSRSVTKKLTEPTTRQTPQAETSMYVRDFYKRVNSMTAINPQNLSKLSAFMANTFGMLYGINLKKILERTYTDSGSLRTNLLNLSQDARGTLRMLLLQDHVTELRRMDKDMRKLLRQRGVPKSDVGVVLQDLIEHMDARVLSVSASDPMSRAVHASRLRLFNERVSSYGITQLDIERLEALALRIETAHNEMASAASDLGVDASNRLEAGSRYLGVEYTPLGSRILTRLRDMDKTPLTVRSSILSGESTLEASVMKSRSTNLFVPEDMTLLVGHMLRHNDSSNAVKLRKLAKENHSPLHNKTALAKTKAKLDNVTGLLATARQRSESIHADLKSLNKMMSDNRNRQRLLQAVRNIDATQKDLVKGGKKPSIKLSKRRESYEKRLESLLPLPPRHAERLKDIKAMLVEDKKALDYLERRHAKLQATVERQEAALIKPYTALDPQIQTEDFNNLATFLTRTIVEDPLKFTQYLADNYPSQFLYELVDAGILQKLPMTSDEIWRFYRDNLPLPLKHRDQFLRSTPTQTMERYAKSLGDAAATSSMFKYVAEAGVSQGWAFRSVDDIPAEYRADFIEVSKAPMKYFAEKGVSLDGIRQLEGLYVHEAVVDTLSSVLRLQMSPSHMSQFARSYARIQQGITLTALANLQSASRAFLGAGLFGYQGTGNNPFYFLNYANAVVDIVTASKGVEVPTWVTGSKDNVTYIVGDGVTRRDIINHILRVRDTGSDVFSDVGGLVNSSERLSAASYNVRLAAHLASLEVNPARSMRENVINEPLRFLSKYALTVAESAGQAVSSVVSPIVGLAQNADLAQRVAMIETIAHPKYGNGIGFKSLDDAVRYTDEYSPTPLYNGSAVRFTNRYVRSFMTYAVFAPGAVIRHAMRNPTNYVNYQRMWALVNEWGNDGDENDPVMEHELSDTLLNGMPIRVGRDNEGSPMFFDVSSLDPTTGEFVNTRESLESLGRALGLKVGSDREVLRSYDPTVNETSIFIMKQLQSLTVPNALFEGLTGIDTFTGREKAANTFGYSTFLGIEMPARLALTLENVPILAATDRINTTQETRAKVFDTPQGYLLEHLGVRTRIADAAENTNRTIRELRSASSNAKNLLERSVEKYYTERDTLSPLSRQRREEGITRLAERQLILEMEIARLDAYAQSQGVSSLQVERKLEQGGAEAARIQAAIDGTPDPVLTGQSEALKRYIRENMINE